MICLLSLYDKHVLKHTSDTITISNSRFNNSANRILRRSSVKRGNIYRCKRKETRDRARITWVSRLFHEHVAITRTCLREKRLDGRDVTVVKRFHGPFRINQVEEQDGLITRWERVVSPSFHDRLESIATSD